MRLRACAVLFAVVSSWPGGSVFAQAPTGPEFRVNIYSTFGQYDAVAASTPGGGFIVTWVSELQDQSVTGVFAQRFDARGTRLGTEFRVNSYTTGPQGTRSGLSLATNARGSFVVAFPGLYPPGTGLDVVARRFRKGASPLGAEFRVNTSTTGQPYPNSAAMGARGQFIVTWHQPRFTSLDIFGRLYDPDGIAQGAEFLVNSVTDNPQERPAVSMAPDGSFVVAFGGFDASNVVGTFARRFDASGSPLGPEFRVNTHTLVGTGDAAVHMAADHSFLVAWAEVDQAGIGSIFARRYDADGNAVGAEFRVSDPSNYAGGPSLAFDGADRFVVAWSGWSDGSEAGIKARRFDAQGTPLGAAFDVNTETTGRQFHPVAASDEVGNFVVTWTTYPDQGTGFPDIHGRRFGGLRPAALSVADGGNRVLEVGDTFTLTTSWRNDSGTAQTFGGASQVLAGPQGLTFSLSPQASYGTVPDGAVGACGASCFGGSLTGQRPLGHLDEFFIETLSPAAQGQAQRWKLHVGDSFADVPRTSGFYRSVETLLHSNVTAGCVGNFYCPGDAATRDQMAVFVLASQEGTDYLPPACTAPLFGDVPASSPFCRWIEELARRGVVGGCGGGNYCPSDPITREQMAVFLLRTLDPVLDPPACTTPMFGDVPASSLFCRWVEELARRGITAGCGGGNYCPTQPVTREQMAAFLTTTFGLTLYGVP